MDPKNDDFKEVEAPENFDDLSVREKDIFDKLSLRYDMFKPKNFYELDSTADNYALLVREQIFHDNKHFLDKTPEMLK